MLIFTPPLFRILLVAVGAVGSERFAWNGNAFIPRGITGL